jgi:hypothetical protein
VHYLIASDFVRQAHTRLISLEILPSVVPAQAGTQSCFLLPGEKQKWIPAYAGMTE